MSDLNELKGMLDEMIRDRHARAAHALFNVDQKNDRGVRAAFIVKTLDEAIVALIASRKSLEAHP